MNDLTPTPTPDEPFLLAVRIDARRAQLLQSNASPAAYFEHDHEARFENLDGVDLRNNRAWACGTVMWCDGALEAMALADYEEKAGYASYLLWDLWTGPEWPTGHAVLTSRPYGSLSS